MTEREEIDKAGMCGNPGLSVWTSEGILVPTLCMKIKGHPGSCEHLLGGFLAALDREIAADYLENPVMLNHEEFTSSSEDYRGC